MATILVGPDGSKGSEAALSEAFDLAKRLDAKVQVAAVAPPVSELLGGSLCKEKTSERLRFSEACRPGAIRRSKSTVVVVHEPS